MSIACRSCGASIDAGDLFCGECGTPVGAAESAPRVAKAERRVVSVLFVDLVGFTKYSEGRDPEEVRYLLSSYFRLAEETIALTGGVVEKFIGDAVMAVWGTPLAREDDPERAVRAGLELIGRVPSLEPAAGLQARAGVYTGEAAVDLAARGQGMVAGDMVNTAARLQGIADPGSILVDRATYLGARDAIAFETAGSLTLKGKDQLVEAWRPTHVIAGKGGRGAEDAIEPDFTGREEEFRMIKDLLHTTGREGKPRLVSIIGIAGIGKSRLIRELFRYVDGLRDDIWWHQGRSPSYGEGVAYWALAEMVRKRTGITETDDDAAAEARLDEWLAEQFPDEAERAWLRPHLTQLIGLEEAVDTPREQLFAAWRVFFERIAQDGPALLIFEDLHWADAGLIDFIEHLMAWTRNSPILVLTLARPELLDRRPTWGVGQRNFVSLHLEPLDEENMFILLKSVAGNLPASIQQEVIKRAEGVPLYAVEMVRMLVDNGDLVRDERGYTWVGQQEHLEVPDSLHSLIASRLDTLETGDRRLIQDASVLGKTFTLGALSFLSGRPHDELDARLQELARRELLTVDKDPMSPEMGQYGFVQSLIREVAYQTLANADRSARHLAAAEFFAAGDEPDLLDVVATHYVEAYRNSRQDERSKPLADKARVALTSAADRAMALGSSAQALSLLEKALSVTDPGLERAELLRKAGTSAMSTGQLEKAVDLLIESTELLADERESELLAQVHVQLGKAYFLASRLDDAEELLKSSVDRLPDPTTTAAAELYAELARIYSFKGDLPQAEECSALAMHAAEKASDIPIIVNTLITRGVNSILSGRVHEAEVLLAGSLGLAERHGLVDEQIRAHVNISASLGSVHPRLAYEESVRGLELARRFGSQSRMAYLVSNALPALSHLGRWEDAHDLYEEVLELKLDELKHLVLLSASELHAFTGDLDALERALRETKDVMEASSNRQDQALIAFATALICLLKGDYRGVAVAVADPALREIVCLTDGADVIGHAALWDGDLEAAKAAIDQLRALPIHNDWFGAREFTLNAGLTALEEGGQAALPLYAGALQRWDDLDIPMGKAMCQMDLAMLVGGPETDAASAEVESFFKEAGNQILVHRLLQVRSSVA